MASLVALLILGQASQEPADLSRIFRIGEKAQVEVKSHLFTETRQYGLRTFMPNDLDMEYKFTTEVTKLKADGVCEMRYIRPTFTRIIGETAERPPQKIVEKDKIDLELTVSNINEILNLKDLTPKKPEKKPGGLYANSAAGPARMQLDIGQYIGQVYRLALFIGNLESGLDISPKLPYDPVNPGDSWKRTVGYSPTNAGPNNKSINQRLDYTFIYKGIVESNGKKVHRVTGSMAMDSDIAKFIHDMLGAKPADTGLRAIKLKLNATIEYDLDLATRRTLYAVANSEGSITIEVTQVPNEPVQEEKLKGTTTLTVLSAK